MYLAIGLFAAVATLATYGALALYLVIEVVRGYLSDVEPKLNPQVIKKFSFLPKAEELASDLIKATNPPILGVIWGALMIVLMSLIMTIIWGPLVVFIISYFALRGWRDCKREQRAKEAFDGLIDAIAEGLAMVDIIRRKTEEKRQAQAEAEAAAEEEAPAPETAETAVDEAPATTEETPTADDAGTKSEETPAPPIAEEAAKTEDPAS